MSLRALCFLFLLPAVLGAQSSRYSYEGLVDRQRLLYPAQRAETTPWLSREGWSVRIDSTTRDAHGARVAFIAGRFGATLVTLGARGSVDAMKYVPEPDQDRADVDLLTHAEWESEWVDVLLRSLPTLFGTAPIGGLKRVPVRANVTRSLFAKQLTGTFRSRRLADTVIDGVTMHQLRDVGEIALNTRTARSEYTRSGIRRDTRALRGRWIVRRVFDPRRTMTVAIHDTLDLRGMETDTMPDNSVVRSPVRFQEYREVIAMDSAAREVYQARQYRERFGGGLGSSVGLPDPPPNVDSLIAAHRRARSQAERDTIESLVQSIYPHVPDVRLAETYLAMGDTARAVLTIRPDGYLPFNARTYELLRPFLDDSHRAMRYGLDIDRYFDFFEYGFTNSPPALAADSLETFCVPSLCARIAREWTRARDPRLRDVGLLAAATSDPHRWGDSLIARARARGDRNMLRGVVGQLINARSRGDSLPALPFPSVNATWREWLAWLRAGAWTPRGRDPKDIRFWIERMDTRGEWMAMQYRGGGYRDTLAARFALAENDTARFVYGRLLQSLGMQRDEATLFRVIERGTPIDIELASYEAWTLPFAPADSATASTLQEQMLRHFIDSLPLWRPAGLPPRGGDWGSGPYIRSYKAYSGFVSPAAAARLRAIGMVPADSAPEAVQLGQIAVLNQVRQVGRFATVGMQYPTTSARYLLVLIDGEWRVMGTNVTVV